MDFTDKVVIVTGASSGIGATCAIHYARYSAKLVITGRNLERLNKIAESCETINHVKPLAIVADLDKEDDIKKIIDETLKKYGQIDILVNNAGVGAKVGLEDGISHYDKVMSTNVRSVYILTSLAIPHIIKTKGNIVNISSIVSARATPQFLPYSMSKAALDMFTKCLAKQYAVNGIRVNSVNPGPVKTNFHASAGFSEDEWNVYVKNRMAFSLLGKFSSTDDVAELVTFLSSDKAKSITGCIHFVENGMLLS